MASSISLLTKEERAAANPYYDVEAQQEETGVVVAGPQKVEVGERIKFNTKENGVSIEVRAEVVRKTVLENGNLELGLRDIKTTKISECHFCPGTSDKVKTIACFVLGIAAVGAAAAAYTFRN